MRSVWFGPFGRHNIMNLLKFIPSGHARPDMEFYGEADGWTMDHGIKELWIMDPWAFDLWTMNHRPREYGPWGYVLYDYAENVSMADSNA